MRGAKLVLAVVFLTVINIPSIAHSFLYEFDTFSIPSNFQFGEFGWDIVSTDSHSPPYAVRAPYVDGNGSYVVHASLTDVADETNIGFWYKIVQMNPTYGALLFEVVGENENVIWPVDTEWHFYSAPVGLGTKTFKWTFDYYGYNSYPYLAWLFLDDIQTFRTLAITGFSLLSPSFDLVVPVTTFTAVGGIGAREYCLTEASTADGCLWNPDVPTSYRFSDFGVNKRLYAFVRDTTGSVSAPVSAVTDVALHGYPVSVTFDGTGTGSISTDQNFSCLAMPCEKTFAEGTTVKFSAAPSAGSTFVGWSGACAGTGECILFIDSGKSVGVTFDVLPYLKLGSSYYGTIRTAYQAAGNGDLILARGIDFPEAVHFDRAIDVLLEGGYNADWQPTAAHSVVSGSVCVDAGAVTFGGLTIR